MSLYRQQGQFCLLAEIFDWFELYADTVPNETRAEWLRKIGEGINMDEKYINKAIGALNNES